MLQSKPKTFISVVPSLGCATFGTMKALGTSQLVSIRSPGTSCCQSHYGPLEVDVHAVCSAGQEMATPCKVCSRWGLCILWGRH